MKLDVEQLAWMFNRDPLTTVLWMAALTALAHGELVSLDSDLDEMLYEMLEWKPPVARG